MLAATFGLTGFANWLGLGPRLAGSVATSTQQNAAR